MKNRTKLIVFAILLVCIFSFTACGKSKKGDENGKKKVAPNFFVQSIDDFSIVYEEKFEEKYYDKAELEKMIDEELAEFNTNFAVDKSKGIEKESFKVADKKATLKLKFHSYNDYIKYASEYISSDRNAILFIGSYNEAVEAGYKFPGKFTTTDKKEYDVTTTTEEMVVIYTNEGFNMDIKGEIVAVNDNVNISGKTASTFGTRENYIIYKK